MSAEIEAMVKANIQAQIVLALKSTPEAIDELVKAALSKPAEIRTGSYSTKQVPYLDHIVGETIRAAADRAIRDEIRDRAEGLKAAIRQALTADRVVDEAMDKIVGAMQDDWNIAITFKDGSDRN